MATEKTTIYVKIVMVPHPTFIDQIGSDGLYVESQQTITMAELIEEVKINILDMLKTEPKD